MIYKNLNDLFEFGLIPFRPKIWVLVCKHSLADDWFGAILYPGFRPGLLYFALSGRKNSHPDFPNLKLGT
jgi:hypothetical protein